MSAAKKKRDARRRQHAAFCRRRNREQGYTGGPKTPRNVAALKRAGRRS
jgi:hypothetical protein